MAVARFAKALFKPVELRLEGGEKMYGLLLAGGAKKLGDGSVAYVRPLQHWRTDEIEDLELKHALKAYVFSLLVDVENYEPLEEDHPLCCMPFSEHNKLLPRNVVGLLIQFGDAVLLCLKVEVYGRSKSEILTLWTWLCQMKSAFSRWSIIYMRSQARSYLGRSGGMLS